jgi:hypothetical protein
MGKAKQTSYLIIKPDLKIFIKKRLQKLLALLQGLLLIL